MDPNIRDGAAAIIRKYGTAPEYVKYKYEDDIVFGKVEHCSWEDPCFTLDIIHTKPLIITHWPGHLGETQTRLSRSWPISKINGKRVRIETATEEEYLMSLVLES